MPKDRPGSSDIDGAAFNDPAIVKRGLLET